MSRSIKLDFFPPQRVELSKEVRNHPELQKLLDKHPVDAFETRLAEISTYCGIILHGDYTQDDLTKLCGKLRDILIQKRTGLVFIN